MSIVENFSRVPLKGETFHRKEEVWNNLQRLTEGDCKPKVRKFSLSRFAIRTVSIAATIVLAFLAVKHAGLRVVETDIVAVSVFLPDGSDVTLYPRSQIKYNRLTWFLHRNVELKGKAYFKVAQGSLFDINTSEGNVSVLGTQFMVVQENGSMTVVCDRGKVKVSSLSGESLEAIAGESVTVTRGKVERTALQQEDEKSLEPENDLVESDTISEPIFTQPPAKTISVPTIPEPQHIFSFKEDPLLSVVRKFENVYGVTVNKKYILEGLIYTGSFTDDDIEKALILIFGPFGISYSIEENETINIYQD